MTQSELAKQLGVSKSYVSMLLSGQRKPSKRVAEKLKQVNLTVNNECGNGLKIRWASALAGSNPALGTTDQVNQFTHKLTCEFLKSRRDGLSQGTLDFYQDYLGLSKSVIGISTTGQQVREFLNGLHCSNGGKHAYYRALHAFYGWMYSPRSGYGLNAQDNPMIIVEPPKVERRILPALGTKEIVYLIDQSTCIRDKAIISLFSDSGLRLSELASIKPQNIDWNSRLIKVWCKGNKEGLAPFGERTESLMREWLSKHYPNGNIWGIGKWDIVEMLRSLRAKTKLPCNAHTFRRSFATILAQKGVDSLHIMRLGRWESIQMVERYTKTVGFSDSLKMYSPTVQ